VRYRHGENAAARERRRDRGTTFVEILVSIVLLGTAVGGTLTALRTTIVSSKVDGDVTKASVWLREAEEALHRTAYKQCSVNTELQIANAYRAAIQAVPPPAGWAGATINLASVQFWGRNATTHVEGWMPFCTGDFVAQLVDIYVLSPTGNVGRHVLVIKSG
jgi:Tfp pilus assembly protein PilX